MIISLYHRVLTETYNFKSVSNLTNKSEQNAMQFNPLLIYHLYIQPVRRVSTQLA